MFNSSKKLVLSFFLGITAIWFWKYCLVTPTEIKKFEKSQAKVQHLANIFPVGQQKRQGVVKDLWISGETKERLHSRIESRHSRLMLVAKKDSVELVEELKKIRGVMQERIASGTQQIRAFTAEEGSYVHSLKQFVANNASLDLYKIPGKEIPASLESYSPLISGTSERILFSLFQKGPKFDAQNFKARIGQK